MIWADKQRAFERVLFGHVRGLAGGLIWRCGSCIALQSKQTRSVDPLAHGQNRGYQEALFFDQDVNPIL
ncbi:MAG: hypothetical protein AAGC83_03235 [Pseudomonadota bacterium]